VESGRIELLWAPFLQLSHCAITFRFTTMASPMPLALPIKRGLMLFNHTERPSEILVVRNVAVSEHLHLMPSHWQPRAEGLRLPIGVRLALDLHDLILPQMGQSVLNLALGDAFGDFVLDRIPNLGDSRGSGSQRTHHDVVDGIVGFGVLCLGFGTLVDFLVQFGKDFFIGETEGGQSGLDGFKSGFLHSVSSFPVCRVFLPFIFHIDYITDCCDCQYFILLSFCYKGLASEVFALHLSCLSYTECLSMALHFPLPRNNYNYTRI